MTKPKTRELSANEAPPLIYTKDGLNNFDAIRLAMALLVVWSHSFALGSSNGESGEPISVITNGHYNAGNIGVMVFFAISGFLICESYLRSGNTLRFLIKRVRRIYPGYIVATSIGAFVVIPLFSTVYEICTAEVMKTLGLNLLLRGYAPPSNVFAENYSQALNGSLWSIPFEFWCYLGILALGIVGLLTRPRFIVSITVLAVISRATLDMMDKKPGLGLIGDIFGWPYEWLLVLPCFLIGTVFYLLKGRLPRSRLTLTVLIFGFLIACYVPTEPKWQKILAEATFPIAMGYSVFYFAFSNAFRLRNVASNGDFSYGTYLYAFPIQQMLLSKFSLPFPIFVMLSLSLSLGAGVLSWNIVEKWFLSRDR